MGVVEVRQFLRDAPWHWKAGLVLGVVWVAWVVTDGGWLWGVFGAVALTLHVVGEVARQRRPAGRAEVRRTVGEAVRRPDSRVADDDGSRWRTGGP